MKRMILAAAVFLTACGQALKPKGYSFFFDALSVAPNASLAFSVDSTQKPQTNELGRVVRWKDQIKGEVNLYPPNFLGSQTLNTSLSAIYQPLSDRAYIRFNSNTSLAPAVNDIDDLKSDEFTFVMVLKDLVIPENDPRVLRLFNFFPSDGSAAGYFVVDVTKDQTELVFTALEYFDATTYASREIRVSAEEAKQPIALAMSADRDGRKVQVSVNGRLPTKDAVVVGTNHAVSAVTRTLILHGLEDWYGSHGEFSLSHFLIFKTAATSDELRRLSKAFHMGPMGLEPGAPIDIGGGDTLSAGAKLYQANCASCHGPLATSPKLNRTLDQLNSAISSVSAMNHLSALSASDRQKIVDALN